MSAAAFMDESSLGLFRNMNIAKYMGSSWIGFILQTLSRFKAGGCCTTVTYTQDTALRDPRSLCFLPIVTYYAQRIQYCIHGVSYKKTMLFLTSLPHLLS